MNLEGMRARLERRNLEPIDPDLANEVISDAVKSLWNTLIKANVGDYISRQPPDLTEDADIIPFEELCAIEFITYYALVPVAIGIHEYDQAKAWEGLAEKKRDEVVEEVLKKSIRQENVKPFNPYNAVGTRTRIL